MLLVDSRFRPGANPTHKVASRFHGMRMMIMCATLIAKLTPRTKVLRSPDPPGLPSGSLAIHQDIPIHQAMHMSRPIISKGPKGL